jgi:two-component system chemotaxis response regulator CheY
MQVLASSQRLKILEYTTRLKFQLAEWLIVEVKLIDLAQKDFTTSSIADVMGDLFKDREGMVLACNNTEVLMLIQWGKDNNPHQLAKAVRSQLPSDVCEATVTPPTKEGLKKIVLAITSPKTEDGAYYATRIARQNNVVLVADDDMYIRSLAKAGLADTGMIIETSDGTQVLPAYKIHNPDIVLLDIHMPGLNGPEILNQLRALDPRTYVIMLSADSSAANVMWAQQHGAKGFLTKPLNKTKLLEYVDMCPTIKQKYTTI